MKKSTALILSLIYTACFLIGCAENPLESQEITDDETSIDLSVTDFVTTEEIIESEPVETIVFDEYQNAYRAAYAYYYGCGTVAFEEGDVVHVDQLMYYYQLFEILDGSWHVKESLTQYETVKNRCEICVPKSVVNETLTAHFAVVLDDTNSIYNDPEQEGYYLIGAAGQDGNCVRMENIRENGTRITADYILADAFTGEVYDRKEMCIENPESDDFRIIYARPIK